MNAEMVTTDVVFSTDRNKPELIDLAGKIVKLAREAIDSSHDALEAAIAAGGLLVKAKGRVLHGKWQAWLAENFEFSQTTATNWMRLWENRTELKDLIKDMPKQYMSVADALRLVSDAPVPQPKTKFQKVKKCCENLIKELYSQTPAEARKSRDLLIEHGKDISTYIREHTR